MKNYTLLLLAFLFILNACDNAETKVSQKENDKAEDVNIPTFRADVLPMECDDNMTGGIIISNSVGGNGDYLYSIDGGQTWIDQTLFDDLMPDTYDVMIQDGNGCESIVSGLVIPEPIILGVDSGEDAEVQFGENNDKSSRCTQRL